MEQIKFYFDHLKYAEKMRHIRLSIMYAKEIVQAVAKSEINADIDIIRGLYDVHYEKQETVQNNVQVVGALNNSNTPKMYNNVLVTNERGERAFNAYLEEQLSRYQECFVGKNTRFILLSLAPKLVLPKPWNYLDYSDLAEKMKDKFSYKNDYDKYLIDDYINVVTQLVNAFPKTSPQKYDFYEKYF